MNTAIILGYGLFEETNQEYKDYLDWALKNIVDKQIEKMIFCGGFTNSSRRETSESQSMYSYLEKFLPPNTKVVVEDKSITTTQNILFSKGEINPDDRIFVHCDLARLAKVIWLSARILLGKSQSEVSNSVLDFYNEKKIRPFSDWNLTVFGFEFPSRDKYQYLTQSFTSLLEVESLDDQVLADKIELQRKRDFGLI